MTEPLQAQIFWTQDDSVDPNGATLGKLRLFVGGTLIWGEQDGIDWIWRDLLVHLAECWSQLLYEDWIEPVGERRITDAHEDYARSLELLAANEELGEDAVVAREAMLYQWEQDHNLARALPGLTVPDVRVWADRAGIVVETAKGRKVFGRLEAEASLARIGDDIAQRLVSQGLGNDAAVAAWTSRFPMASDTLAAGATGLPVAALATARAGFSEADAWGDAMGRMQTTSWLEAARACSLAGSGALRGLLAAVGSSPPPTRRWEEVVDAIVEVAATGLAEGPVVQDSATSRLLREIGGLDPFEPLRPGDLSYGAGVELHMADLESRALAALVVHGLDHAPVIVTNLAVCGTSREPLRRVAFARAVSLLSRAVPTGRPGAWAVQTSELEAGTDQRALRLVLPPEGIEEHAAEDSSPGLIGRLAAHYGVPMRVVAVALRANGAWRRTTEADKIEAAKLLQGDSRVPVFRPDLRLIS